MQPHAQYQPPAPARTPWPTWRPSCGSTGCWSGAWRHRRERSAPPACTRVDTQGPGHPRLVPGHAPQGPLAPGLRGVVGVLAWAWGIWLFPSCPSASWPRLTSLCQGLPSEARAPPPPPCREGVHHECQAAHGRWAKIRGVLRGELRERQPNGMMVPAPRATCQASRARQS